MRKLLLLLFVMGANFISAQNDSIYRLTNKTLQAGVNQISLRDDYLSPLEYNGNGLFFMENNFKFFNNKTDKVISLSSRKIAAAMLVNPRGTAAMMYLALAGDFGVFYRFCPIKHLKIFVGGSLAGDVGFKYLSRNVNNPFNADMAVNLNVAAFAQYKVPIRKHALFLETKLTAPALGAMFVPERGVTYYEMSLFTKNIANSIHFSSLTNRTGYTFDFNISLPLGHWTALASFNHENLRYKAHDSFYMRNTTGISVGCRYHFYRFAGRINAPPKNFKSPIE